MLTIEGMRKTYPGSQPLAIYSMLYRAWSYADLINGWSTIALQRIPWLVVSPLLLVLAIMRRWR
jgi:hypothetical protein